MRFMVIRANEKGHKPTYIDMWTKLSGGLDKDEIKKCMKILGKEFFTLGYFRCRNIRYTAIEDTKLSYDEDYAPHIK